MKNIKIISLIIVLIVTITLLTIRWLTQKDNSRTEKVQLSLGVQMVDQNNKRILKAVKIHNNKFEGNFLITAASNQDTYFDLILINNYKQIEFSLNGTKAQKKHQIFIPKTTEKNYLNSRITITTDNVEGGLNDSVDISVLQSHHSGGK
ncbi:MAG: hypothetical protein M0021_10135 [Clostridia bacterium]|nr:hypothetical protein [Clostridia bacterium]